MRDLVSPSMPDTTNLIKNKSFYKWRRVPRAVRWGHCTNFQVLTRFLDPRWFTEVVLRSPAGLLRFCDFISLLRMGQHCQREGRVHLMHISHCLTWCWVTLSCDSSGLLWIDVFLSKFVKIYLKHKLKQFHHVSFHPSFFKKYSHSLGQRGRNIDNGGTIQTQLI